MKYKKIILAFNISTNYMKKIRMWVGTTGGHYIPKWIDQQQLKITYSTYLVQLKQIIVGWPIIRPLLSFNKSKFYIPLLPHSLFLTRPRYPRTLSCVLLLLLFLSIAHCSLFTNLTIEVCVLSNLPTISCCKYRKVA